MLNNISNFFKSFKTLETGVVSRDKHPSVAFGTDADICWETNRLIQKPDENLARVLKEDILEYHKNYGILEDEILEYRETFQLKGWKKEEGSCTQYLLQINPIFRIYFFCDSQRVCRRVKFLYKRE